MLFSGARIIRATLNDRPQLGYQMSVRTLLDRGSCCSRVPAVVVVAIKTVAAGLLASRYGVGGVNGINGGWIGRERREEKRRESEPN